MVLLSCEKNSPNASGSGDTGGQPPPIPGCSTDSNPNIFTFVGLPNDSNTPAQNQCKKNYKTSCLSLPNFLSSIPACLTDCVVGEENRYFNCKASQIGLIGNYSSTVRRANFTCADFSSVNFSWPISAGTGNALFLGAILTQTNFNDTFFVNKADNTDMHSKSLFLFDGVQMNTVSFNLTTTPSPSTCSLRNLIISNAVINDTTFMNHNICEGLNIVASTINNLNFLNTTLNSDKNKAGGISITNSIISNFNLVVNPNESGFCKFIGSSLNSVKFTNSKITCIGGRFDFTGFNLTPGTQSSPGGLVFEASCAKNIPANAPSFIIFPSVCSTQ